MDNKQYSGDDLQERLSPQEGYQIQIMQGLGHL